MISREDGPANDDDRSIPVVSASPRFLRAVGRVSACLYCVCLWGSAGVCVQSSVALIASVSCRARFRNKSSFFGTHRYFGNRRRI